MGYEEDGKNNDFSRPVLIIKKFSKKLFLGIPLTTKIKEHPLYHKIHFKGKEQSAMLLQVKILDSKRLTDKMGQISSDQFGEIKTALKLFF